MPKIGCVAATAAILLASAAPTAAADTAVAYSCTGGVLVVADFGVEAGRVLLTFGKRRVVLTRVRSGSGARYSNGKTIFWIKGREARLIDNGRETHCRATED
jgi:membrane-bound inhibitor of C-type lysozyme